MLSSSDFSPKAGLRHVRVLFPIQYLLHCLALLWLLILLQLRAATVHQWVTFRIFWIAAKCVCIKDQLLVSTLCNKSGWFHISKVPKSIRKAYAKDIPCRWPMFPGLWQFPKSNPPADLASLSSSDHLCLLLQWQKGRTFEGTSRGPAFFLRVPETLVQENGTKVIPTWLNASQVYDARIYGCDISDFSELKL